MATPTRDEKALNLMKNMGVIMMTTMTIAMAEALSGVAKKFGESLGEALVTATSPKDAGKFKAEYEKNTKNIPLDILSEVKNCKKEVDEQYKANPGKFKAIIASPIFDDMLKVVGKHDIALPRLTEAMDEKALSMYVALALADDKTISPLLRELNELQAKLAEEMEKKG